MPRAKLRLGDKILSLVRSYLADSELVVVQQATGSTRVGADAGETRYFVAHVVAAVSYEIVAMVFISLPISFIATLSRAVRIDIDPWSSVSRVRT